MKRIGCSVLTLLSVLLTACGGSGSGDYFNSSFEKTFTFGSQTYVCRSERQPMLVEARVRIVPHVT